MVPSYDFSPVYQTPSDGLLFETGISSRYNEIMNSSDSSAFQPAPREHYLPERSLFTSFEPFAEQPPGDRSLPPMHPLNSRVRTQSGSTAPFAWAGQRSRTSSDWLKSEGRTSHGFSTTDGDTGFRNFQGHQAHAPAHEVIYSIYAS